MAWEPYQAFRLAQERQTLTGFLPQLKFYELTGSTYVAGSWTSNKGRIYGIRITLPKGFPDECPSTYITHPSPLFDYRGRALTSHGTSAAMHVWQTDKLGWVKICTFRPEYWNASISLSKVARKALLWITAFECHLDDGSPLSRFLIEA